MFTADPKFVASMRVTLFFVVFSVPLKLAFALARRACCSTAACAACRSTARIFYLPSLLGASVAIAMLWRQLFAGDGLVNDLLAIFGIAGPELDLATRDYSLWTLVILAIWQFGSPMIIFLAGLRQIPQDMYEAASLDGASKWRQFWKITLPLLTPVIFFNAIIQTIEAFKASRRPSSSRAAPAARSTRRCSTRSTSTRRRSASSAWATPRRWPGSCWSSSRSSPRFSFLTSRYWVHYDD